MNDTGSGRADAAIRVGERASNTQSFWGKARPLCEDQDATWHPLPFHSVDVAAVAQTLLERNQRFRSSLTGLLGVSCDEKMVAVVCYLISLHDIGKFAKQFQAKEPKHFPACFNEDPRDIPTSFDHGRGFLELYDSDWSLFLPSESESPRGWGAWRPLISAVAGHHGAPPWADLEHIDPVFGQIGIAAARQFVREVRQLWAPPAVEVDARTAKRASWAIAGLATLADWIGSKQEWFPYTPPGTDLGKYLETTRKNAEEAVDKAGILPAKSVGRLRYSDLIGDYEPSPMQRWARDVELPDGPALYVIEDDTGSGKTEAALMLSYRLIARGGAEGLYIALPTMATANAMFDRLARVQRHLFEPASAPSISLAHSARWFHRGFRSVTLNAGRDEQPYSTTGELDSETTASTACAAWISDDRRKAFLADIGAGTIDQALLAVLPSRFHSLRLHGLMRRVLVLDEVHAYDAYMIREMEALLEFQAGLGGSVVLLSATLPLESRERLVGGFARGLGDQGQSASEARVSAYPLATIRARGVHAYAEVDGQRGRARRLPVRFVNSPDEGIEIVRRAANAGQAALYIRNTVDDALETHHKLSEKPLNRRPFLFHSRFALADRLDIERRVTSSFGKQSTADDRRGRILIATQVVEQSLDLDFDVIVSDLAPIDLLMQRAGRLWRHDRRERQGSPELVVVGPEAVRDADDDWFRRSCPRASYVYQDHARLWLTANVLMHRGSLDTPWDSRSLVEEVYGENAFEQVPEGLMDAALAAMGRRGADQGMATTNVLKFRRGYLAGDAWDSEWRVPTRLNDHPRVTLRLACLDGGQVVPYAKVAPHFALRQDRESTEAEAWRLSEVAVSAMRVSDEAIPGRIAEAARAARAGWRRWEDEKILVVLDPVGGGAYIGAAKLGDRDIQLEYSPLTGVKHQDAAKIREL